MNKMGKKLQWFFFVIFIPLLFTIIVATVVLSLLGLNPIEKSKEWTSNVPIISSYIEKEEEKDYEAQIIQLEETITEQQKELERLQAEVKAKDEEISTLTFEQQSLIENEEIEKEIQLQTKKEWESIAKTYEAMSAKNAAAIIADLPIEEALLHISEVSIEARADILAKMDSDIAANIMSRLAND